MTKTKKMGLAALCALALGGSAQAQKQMVVKLQGSEKTVSFSLSSIEKATFLDAKINFTAPAAEGDSEETTPNVIQSFALKDIESITFTDITNAIGSVQASSTEKLQVSVSGNTLHVKGVTVPTTLTIFATTGQVVKQVSQFAGTSVNIASIQPGVYLVKVGNQSAKFSK